MQSRVEVHFESIELKEQRIQRLPDDFARSVVRFGFRYPDGRIETGCTATVWHALGALSGGTVRITLPSSYQCPAYRQGLERSIEEYYRRQVDFDGRVIHIGPWGASPPTIGIPVVSPACAEFEVTSNTAG